MPDVYVYEKHVDNLAYAKLCLFHAYVNLQADRVKPVDCDYCKAACVASWKEKANAEG